MGTTTNTNKQQSPAKSMAEAKLQRQKEREQKAEAALFAPPPTLPSLPLEKERQILRKGKWKPFDYAAEPGSGGDAAFPEIRLNVAAAQGSRGSSMNRSISSMSQRSGNTGPSDASRHEPSYYGTENDGFQVYSRKNRRTLEHLGAYEEKSPEKQTTVEAAFDKREIYDVFGNAVPGLEFMEENVGFKNGQVQFAQHPNGDVSAHQWSTSRYMWENIGQFSNIRKKIEGQLASDRLKGETGYQTVHRNTLVYFRTIAKQREANVMNLPFGLKEIQASIPNLQAEQEIATGPKVMKPNGIPARRPLLSSTAAAGNHSTSSSNLRGQSDPFMPSSTRFPQYQGFQYHEPPAAFSQYLPYTAASSFPSKYSPVTEFTPATQSRCEDPFYTSVPSITTYGPFSSPAVTTPKATGVVYNSFGAVTNPDPTQPPTPYKPDQIASSAVETNPAYANATLNAASKPKPVTPLTNVNRSAMRNHLIKLTDQAKERSGGQASNRTLVFDPIKDDATGSPCMVREDSKFNSQISPTSNTARKLSDKYQASPNTVRDGTQIPTVARLGESTPEVSSSNRSARALVPFIGSVAPAEATPQVFENPYLHDVSGLPGSAMKDRMTQRRTREKKVSDWWSSGKTFQRQEDLFQSVQDNWLNGKTTTPTRPFISPTSGRMTAAASTPRKGAVGKHEPNMTRLLIPVLENLASYVQGPVEKRHDYFCQWSKAPDWCIDRSPNGNKSFYDSNWGQPPARIGRDPRYQPVSDRMPVENLRFGAFNSPQRPDAFGGVAVGTGIGHRFAYRGARM